MRVTNVKTTVLSIPFKETYYWSQGCTPGINSVLVEVETDEGITGIGEACGDRSVEAIVGVIDSAARVLAGENPFDIERFLHRFYKQAKWDDMRRFAHQAVAGVEMALWDIVGKACDKPLYVLWGGAFRKKIEYYGYVNPGTPEQAAAQAVTLVAEGFRTLYLKIGFAEAEDLARVSAIREAVGPGPKIRVDANQSWSVAQAIRIIGKLSKYDLEFVDQPVLMYNLDALSQVRAGVDVPIASHESSWTMYEALNVLKRGAADVIHVDPRFDAGFTGARLTAGMAEAAGVPVVAHSYTELGVTQCAYMHLIASAPNFTLANQTSYRALTDDVIKAGLLPFKDGCLDLPEGPGIGVKLDPDKVATYAELYHEHVRGREFVLPSLRRRYMLMQYRGFFASD